ncbi:MAG: cytochrome P450 [Pseudanabaenaceae cyanobacterium]|jgi:cytochrome P450
MSLPDGPKTPALWQTLYWIADPIGSMREYSQKYGDCFSLKIGYKLEPLVMISDPEVIQMILTNDESKIFEAPGELNGLVEPLLGRESVIALSGTKHRRMRQLMMPPFHGERMRSYGKIISDITDQVIQEWSVGKTFNLRDVMQQISLAVILKAVFGLQDGSRYEELGKALTQLLDQMSNPLSVAMLYFPKLQQDLGPWSPWGRFMRQRQRVDDLIYAEINERRANPDDSRDDILSLLMSATDESGECMSNAELRDELMTLLTAGHETTATGMSWALYWLHHLPEVRQKLLAELTENTANLEQTLTKLPYLNAVCSETLRIYPVAMVTFPRIVKEPMELMGYTITPNTMLLGCIYTAHHRESVYEDPDTFKPERFLERQFSPFEYLPFGGGSRRCIGMAFAMFEMKTVLSRIMTQVELSLVDDRPLFPVRRGVTASLPPVQMRVNGKRNVGQSLNHPVAAT